jgi:hypothetical protein
MSVSNNFIDYREKLNHIGFGLLAGRYNDHHMCVFPGRQVARGESDSKISLFDSNGGRVDGLEDGVGAGHGTGRCRRAAGARAAAAGADGCDTGNGGNGFLSLSCNIPRRRLRLECRLRSGRAGVEPWQSLRSRAVTFSGRVPGAPINDPIPSYSTTDLYYTYTVPKPNLTMRLGVQNLFDRLPPFQAGQQFYPLLAGVYDPRGRMFTPDAKMGL